MASAVPRTVASFTLQANGQSYTGITPAANTLNSLAAAINAATNGAATATIVNLGTGEGVTVRELLHTFEQVFGRPVPTVDGLPRPGDSVGAFANVDKARDLLGWSSQLSLADGIESALAWNARRREVLCYD